MALRTPWFRAAMSGAHEFAHGQAAASSSAEMPTRRPEESLRTDVERLLKDMPRLRAAFEAIKL